jgi:glycosyltransferase involved in cell wall biosynthesis
MNARRHIGFAAVGGKGWMGGANYIRHLAAAVRAASPECEVSFWVGSTIAEDWADAQPRHMLPVDPPLLQRLLGAGKKPLGERLRDAGVDFLYPITYDNRYNLGVDFPISKRLGGVGWAGWIPDFQHHFLPEFFTREEIEFRTASIRSLAAEAQTLVFSSESAVRDFHEFYPGFAGRIEVLRFGATPFTLPRDDSALVREAPERFFLVCNQFWRHKNHLVVFEALRILRSRGIEPIVLCTGLLHDYRNASFGGEIEAAIAEGGIASQVRILGLVPRERQLALMRRAIAVVQPSLFEGWSTVVEDIRAVGRRSLLSDLAVHREQNPDGARFFDPRSAEALAGAMAEAWAEWSAGPDFEREAAALDAARLRLAEVGRRMIAIAAP